jgi:phage terminase Nu1 subunit (DNA packaging protein)
VTRTTGTKSGYAEHIKASPAYVSKLAKQHRLVTFRDDKGRELVDFDATDRLVRNTADMGRARNGANASPGREPSTPIEPIAGAGRVDAIFRQAQAQERAFNAKMAELEYRKAIGEVVLAADVKAEYARLMAGVREAFLQIPSRVVPMLVGAQGAHQMDQILRQEVNRALESIVGEGG